MVKGLPFGQLLFHSWHQLDSVHSYDEKSAGSSGQDGTSHASADVGTMEYS
ncbi:hypothetical protein D3C87_2071840 [compost metagenome]